jgi:hypothetical protein
LDTLCPRIEDKIVRSEYMRTKALLYLIMLLGMSFIVASPVWLDGQQNSGSSVRIDGDDIGGVVTSAKDRKPASGSSPRQPIFPPNMQRSWLPMIEDAM